MSHAYDEVVRLEPIRLRILLIGCLQKYGLRRVKDWLGGDDSRDKEESNFETSVRVDELLRSDIGALIWRHRRQLSNGVHKAAAQGDDSIETTYAEKRPEKRRIRHLNLSSFCVY